MTTGVGSNAIVNNNIQTIDAKKLGFPLPVVFAILSHADDKTKAKLEQCNKTFHETVFAHVEFNAKEVIGFLIEMLGGQKYPQLAKPELVKALYELLKDEDQDLYVAHTISQVKSILPAFKRKLIAILMQLDAFELSALKDKLKEFGNPVMFKNLIDLTVFYKKIAEHKGKEVGPEKDQAISTLCIEMAESEPDEVIFIAETKILSVNERSRCLRAVAVGFFNAGKVKAAFELASQLRPRYQYHFVADLLKSKAISPEIVKKLIVFANSIEDEYDSKNAIKDIYSLLLTAMPSNSDLTEFDTLVSVANDSFALEQKADVLIKKGQLLDAAKLSHKITDRTITSRIIRDICALLMVNGQFLETLELCKTIPFPLSQYTVLKTLLKDPKAEDFQIDVIFALLAMNSDYELRKSIELVISILVADYRDYEKCPNLKVIHRLLEVMKTVDQERIEDSIQDLKQLIETLANEHKEFVEYLNFSTKT